MNILYYFFRFKAPSVALICTLLFPLSLFAYDFKVDGLAYNINSDGLTVTLTSDYSNPPYQSIAPNLIIPDKVEYNGVNYSVTGIGLNAFKGCTQLNSVIIGNSVTTIMDGAFWSCSGLSSVSFGDSIVSIGENAFCNCSSIESVIIPSTVNYMGASVFYGCRKLSSIIIPNLVTFIGDNAFYRCDSLKSVRLGDSVKSIGYSAFGYCTKLKSLEIPDCVESIGEKAFTDCYGLESVTIGESVTTIGELAFDFCEHLKVIKFNAVECAQFPSTNFTSNGKNTVFTDCPIERIEFGESVKHIPGFFAAWITTAETIVLSESVISIGQYAFGRCESLGSIIIPDSMELIAESAFYGCKGLKTITSFVVNPNQISMGASVFEMMSTQNCILKVPKGCVESYRSAAQWCDFLNIEEIQEPIVGDINNDGLVDVSDINELVNIILGKVSDSNCNSFADTNDDGKIDVTDVNNVVNIILGKTFVTSGIISDTFEFIDKNSNAVQWLSEKSVAQHNNIRQKIRTHQSLLD